MLADEPEATVLLLQGLADPFSEAGSLFGVVQARRGVGWGGLAGGLSAEVAGWVAVVGVPADLLAGLKVLAATADPCLVGFTEGGGQALLGVGDEPAAGLFGQPPYRVAQRLAVFGEAVDLGQPPLEPGQVGGFDELVVEPPAGPLVGGAGMIRQ
jgi:hypothetical protein